MVTATYTGTSNFQVQGLNAQNASTTDLLVNAIGNYSGTTAFGLGGLSSSNPPGNLKVTASGPWTIKIAPISTAPVLSVPANGMGDAVYQWNGKASTWTLSHTGSSNFIVSLYTGGAFSIPTLVNEIGDYHGSVPVKAGPGVLTIQAQGTWSISG